MKGKGYTGLLAKWRVFTSTNSTTTGKHTFRSYNAKTHEATGLVPYDVCPPFDVHEERSGKDGEMVKEFARRMIEVGRKVRQSNIRAMERQERLWNVKQNIRISVWCNG